ncbi:hypothetical protein [Streptomyces sp. NPDC003077]|uniref:hypothetical protein n=1 Tax=Streptomyces sp. NPDC003077 TaxID=3154443 RepID=UPI0033B13258
MKTKMFRSGAAVAVALGAAVLAGCGAAHGAGAADPASAGSATAVRPASPGGQAGTSAGTSAGAVRTTALSLRVPPGCREGHCTVTVAQGRTLAMDVNKFGFGRLTVVRVSAGAVSLRATGPGITLSSTVPPGQSALLNNLLIRVGSVTGHVVTLVLTVH